MRRYRRAPVAAILIAGACGGTTPQPALWNRAPQLPIPECSHEHVMELETWLGHRWSDRGDFELRCAGGRFPELGFFVEARWSNERRVGIVGIDRDREIVPFIELVAEPYVRAVVPDPFIVDLDGNGIDEIGDVW